jgi:DNA repair protein RadC
MTLRKSLTPEERPRERLTRHGAKSLTDAELIALMLGSGLPGRHAIGVAHDILKASHGLRGLQRQSVQQLQQIKGLGPARACLLTACFELAARTSLSAIRSGSALHHPEQVKDYCRQLLSNEPIEHCVALLLNTQNHVIDCLPISRGTLSEAAVYPREVVKLALEHHAKALILAHNHPSGMAEPSPSDISLTDTLAEALSLVDVVLLDHIIVAGPQAISLTELGYLRAWSP